MQTVEEAYAVIAQNLADAIAEPWAEAWVVATDLDEDAGTFESRYRPDRPGADEAECFVEFEVLDAFEVLHRAIRAPDGAPWRAATFRLWPDGRFGLAFDYGAGAEPSIPGA